MRKGIWLLALGLSVVLYGCGPLPAHGDGKEAATVAESASQSFAESSVTGRSTEETVPKDAYAYTGSREGLLMDAMGYFTFVSNTVTHTDASGELLLLDTTTDSSFFSQCAVQAGWIGEVIEKIEIRINSTEKSCWNTQDRTKNNILMISIIIPTMYPGV